jgi:TetR/AcrR family transcriptional regulator, transcriptional repressor of aconitase
MPKVSQQYLERRREHILDAARRCFARKGFYETSMQDVFRESGLSAGAVYRYYKSKDDLIQEIAGQAYGQIASVLEDALAQDPVPGIDEIIGELTLAAENLSGPDGATRIALTAWAAALHDPAVATVVRAVLSELRGWWVRVAQRLRDDGRLAAGADPDAVGAALFSVMPGFILQYLILGDVDPAMFRDALRHMIRPEILSAAAPARSGTAVS